MKPTQGNKHIHDRARTKIDPHAPKPSFSALELYKQSLHGTCIHKNQPLNKLRQSKYYNDMFQLLPSHEKDSWYMASYQDKTRYLMELSTYIPPIGNDARGFSVTKSLGRIFEDKSKRDRNAPKKPATPFSLLSQRMAPQFFAKEGSTSAGSTVKRRGRQNFALQVSLVYSKLDATEMASLRQCCDLDVERYQKEMEEYIPPPGFNMYGQKEDSMLLNKKNKGKKRKIAYKPRSAFHLYKCAHVLKYLNKNRNMKEREINTILKEKWKHLSHEGKNIFQEIAKEDKVRYLFEMEKVKRLEGKDECKEEDQEKNKQKDHHEKNAITCVEMDEEEEEDLEDGMILFQVRSNQKGLQKGKKECTVTSSTNRSCQNFYTTMATFLDPIKE